MLKKKDINSSYAKLHPIKSEKRLIKMVVILCMVLLLVKTVESSNAECIFQMNEKSIANKTLKDIEETKSESDSGYSEALGQIKSTISSSRIEYNTIEIIKWVIVGAILLVFFGVVFFF